MALLMSCSWELRYADFITVTPTPYKLLDLMGPTIHSTGDLPYIYLILQYALAECPGKKGLRVTGYPKTAVSCVE